MKQCPSCASAIGDAATVCRFCQADLEAWRHAELVGAPLPETQQLAVHVPAPVAEPPIVAPPRLVPVRRRIGLKWWLSGAVVTVLMAAALWFLTRDDFTSSIDRQPSAEAASARVERLRRGVLSSVAVDPGALIANFGAPDRETSSEHDNPRPPLVTRTFEDTTAGVRVVYVPTTREVPYVSWKVAAFIDMRSETAISGDAAIIRLAGPR